MNRKDLVKALVSEGHFKLQKDADACVQDITTIIKGELQAGNEVELFGFGKFFTAVQKGKSGNIPGSTKTYTTQDKVVPRFKAAKAFKESVASGK